MPVKNLDIKLAHVYMMPCDRGARESLYNNTPFIPREGWNFLLTGVEGFAFHAPLEIKITQEEELYRASIQLPTGEIGFKGSTTRWAVRNLFGLLQTYQQSSHKSKKWKPLRLEEELRYAFLSEYFSTLEQHAELN